MPDVPQYDWSKLKPAQLESHKPKGTQDFAKYYVKEAPKNSKHGRIKTTIPPKKKRVKAIDPTISQYHDNALKRWFKNLI